MLKLPPRTVLQISKLYRLVEAEAPLKRLKNLKITSHLSHAQAELTVDQRHYALIFSTQLDEAAPGALWPNLPSAAISLPNPLDETTVVTPFLGKAVVVFYIPTNKRRLDQYLATSFDPSRSRSQWQKHLKAGHVRVNGQVVTAPDHEISPNDTVTADIPKEPSAMPDVLLLYRDRDIIVIDKPEGLLTHAKGGIADEKTVADIFRPQTTFGRETNRPGIVHRLDRDTSGVLVGARTETAAKELQRQFAARTVNKTYLAVVEGQLPYPAARISLPIGRHPSRPGTYRVDANGKSAETYYEVLASTDRYSLVRLRPTTGRTHQLRVHLAHLGTPIVGDRLYGRPADRLLLHAHKLELTVPSGRRQAFTAPVPAVFLAAFPGVQI